MQKRSHTDLQHVLKSQLVHMCIDLVIQNFKSWEAISYTEAYDWLMAQDSPLVVEWKRRKYTQALFEEKIKLTFRGEDEYHEADL